MKQFSCGDVVPGCTAVFHEPDDDALLVAVGRHARADHPLTELTPELVAQVQAATIDGPA